MLTSAQIDHFRTFGFVGLRDFLGEHTAPLQPRWTPPSATPTPLPTTNG